MDLSRRSFVMRIGAGGIGALSFPMIAGRGREALAGAAPQPSKPSPPPAAGARTDLPPLRIRLDSNENPHGPAPAATEALKAAFSETNRYPDEPAEKLQDAVARKHGVPVECVATGCGSTEILRIAAAAFTGPSRGLVTAAPTFEAIAHYAEAIGAGVTRVPVTSALTLDLDAMAKASGSAGLLYVCNPNNPTATARTAAAVRDLIARVTKDSQATVLVDEAYFEYAEDPGYATLIPHAMENPRVVVARTFSKIYGMAGLRVGYAVAQAPTIAAMRKHMLWDSVNGMGATAALASLPEHAHLEEQRRLNREAREFTRRFFEAAGYKVVPSETNFLMADIRRDVRAFRDACRARGLNVGRPFPPLNTHVRVTLGTMEEMRRATEIFAEVLRSA
jgi:histidinol-phosphate aminotransferase